MVNWPAGVSKRVLRDTSWELPSGTIADQTRSGKYKVRAGREFEPNSFTVVIRMNLDEYRIFKNWYVNTTRRGAVSFAFPKLDDTTGTLVEYRFSPESKLSVSNPGGLILDVRMEWLEL